MAVQTLDPVQVKFVNETVRPFLESLVRIVGQFDTFGLDYDNQQNPIAESADDLGDGVDGLVPRVDAPILHGTEMAVLRSIVTNMRAQISAGQYDALISLLVRDLATVQRDRG